MLKVRLTSFIYLIFFGVFPVHAINKSVDVTKVHPSPIGKSISYLQEKNIVLSPYDALAEFSLQNDQTEISILQSHNQVLSFGMDAKPVWLSINFKNPLSKNVNRELKIANSWIDKVDIYFFHENQLERQSHMGDALNHKQRDTDTYLFDVSYNFHPGYTHVLIRIETIDPIVLPVYILNEEQSIKYKEYNAYSYGVLYGAIMSLLMYNFILFLSLKKSHYFFYSVYLFCFLAMNVAYTGHGLKWFWPDAVTWQLWSGAVTMLCFNLSGLVFTNYFLNLKQQSPKSYKLNLYICILFSSLMVGAYAFSSVLFALRIAFILMLMYPLIMIIFGVVALLNKSIAAKYFLVGSIFAAIGSSITALAVLGVIPFNVITYRAVEIGMLIDIILLALALAELFRDINNKKIFAENMALKDPLTSIGNRRSVYNKVNNIWMENNENKENIAIIMLDIDRFKLINDTYGHSFGDEVIIKIAEIIKQNARSKDIFARWGGEEFIMILPSIFGLDTKIFTERISKIIENTLFHVDGEIEKITVSCGIAILDDEKTIDELISSADTQLYNAKKRGRNCVCSTNDFKPLMAI